jgi:hypothetical protein
MAVIAVAAFFVVSSLSLSNRLDEGGPYLLFPAPRLCSSLWALEGLLLNMADKQTTHRGTGDIGGYYWTARWL